jgi:hypothetical protein
LQTLAASVRGGGDAGLSAWGEKWSASCSWSATPAPLAGAAVALPDWLAGRWRVSSSIDGVTFPSGRKFITEAMPGVRMASILPLPNVGAAPTFDLEYGATVEERRAANAKATLEAFWPSATVLSLSTPRAGAVRLRYSSPTKTLRSANQSVALQLCASEGGPVGEDEFVLSEVFQQDNLEQATRGEYLVLTSFRREGAAVRARQRVAAFLQPTDGAYFDAGGKPVALYDYTFRYSRP